MSHSSSLTASKRERSSEISVCEAASLAQVASVAAHGTEATYSAARAQGVADSTNPDYQDWYLGEMRPAFNPVLQQGLNKCAPRARANELTSTGFVFVVKRNGTVGDFISNKNNGLSHCLESQIRAASFPPPPIDELYFGLDFTLLPTHE